MGKSNDVTRFDYSSWRLPCTAWNNRDGVNEYKQFFNPD